MPDCLLCGADGVVIDLWRYVPRRLLKKTNIIERVTRARGIPFKQERVESLQTFLLAFGDQQLVTSLALLIAEFVRHGDISIYSTNVVVSMTLLSSTIHLSTLPVLRDLLRRHRIIRHTRFIAMVCVMVAMVVLLVLQMGNTWWPLHGESDLYFRCGLRYFQVDFGWSQSQQVIVILFFIISYIDAGFLLYGSERPQTVLNAVTQAVERQFDIKTIAPWRGTLVRFQAKFKILARLPDSLVSIAVAESFAYHQHWDAYASEMSTVMFGYAYGITNVFVARRYHEGTTGPFNTWGYGQVVPLAMLILPLYAGLQAYYGEIYSTHSILI
jgi:hypothetical protein